MESLASLFALASLVFLAGIIVPFGKWFDRLKPYTRKHYALGWLICFVGFTIASPGPSPEVTAAREAREAKAADAAMAEAEEAEAKDAEERAAARAAKAAEEHNRILAKAEEAIAYPADYTRSEYPDTYAKLGAETFAELGELEPGAIYAAAESRQCDKVLSAAISDVSSRGKPIWFVDCSDEKRFMISEEHAKSALHRLKVGRLAKSKLSYSCTYNSISKCKREAEKW
jgi:hypothetical protein|tara:strand:- start:1379 stop:2065 length:687 start_codon:yes stop_codon:yes gene_type:complete